VELKPSVKLFSILNKALEFADVIILPLPCSLDNKTINMPMSGKRLLISELFEQIQNSQIVVAGHVSSAITGIAQQYNVYMLDYYDREELKVLNAIPTVEGALKIAMEETVFTIHGSRCMVTGYGRIGKLLCHTLKSLGAVVTASARTQSDLAWIKTFGYDAVKTASIESIVSAQDIIFNTIPSTIFDKKILERVSKDCLIIDLASKPGGVDIKAASLLGIKTIWALSIPGKVAPVTAGRIIADTIINLMKELVV
jgi:dipicolinate synthase subunit A